MPASKLDENTPASLTVSLNGQSVHFGQTIQPQKKWTLFLVPESPYYRVKLDPSSGAVRSIYDKQLQKELVDEKSSYRFGQYLYVAGGDKEPNSILQYRVVSPKPDLQIHAAAQGHLVSVEPTVYGWRAPLESSAENTPMIASEIRLFENEKKI
jgi:alpha-mannosidase